MQVELNQLAESLEQKALDLIEAGRWQELSDMIAPECQFVTTYGVFEKAQAMALMQGMGLKDASIRSVRANACNDTLVVSFKLACTEWVAGKPQRRDFSPRLSVWKKIDGTYKCIAYGDFNRSDT